ncbi:hypothetical protein HU200_053556 [Digitaria exilis]|uniref:Uncharacterized protein n=1 Tax=Digitaria exilis TaxID=1010633 RepID=A0A835AML1_9POAL|nr:hypothetical protein HU200_053556 [Digitaria exilis]
MGQQQDPPQITWYCLDICGSNCTQSCNNKADAEYGKCNITVLQAYENCSRNCTSDCNGKSFARASCTMGSCSPRDCGNPCARSCCESCTKNAPDFFSRCMSSRGMVMSNCMSPCMNNCMPYCINSGGALPSMP